MSDHCCVTCCDKHGYCACTEAEELRHGLETLCLQWSGGIPVSEVEKLLADKSAPYTKARKERLIAQAADARIDAMRVLSGYDVCMLEDNDLIVVPYHWITDDLCVQARLLEAAEGIRRSIEG